MCIRDRGAGDQLMVNGFVMVGAILLNKSPVNLTQITPIARLTAEAEVIVVPTESPLKTAKDLAERLKADPAKVTWAGGSAGGTDHILSLIHIYVYKRQEDTRTDRTGLGPGLQRHVVRMARRQKLAARGRDPVSYTHLDVYKRQAIHR